MTSEKELVADAVIEAGRRLACCAFNISQRSHLTINERLSLNESREQWDAAIAAMREAALIQSDTVGVLEEKSDGR